MIKASDAKKLSDKTRKLDFQLDYIEKLIEDAATKGSTLLAIYIEYQEWRVRDDVVTKLIELGYKVNTNVPEGYKCTIKW